MLVPHSWNSNDILVMDMGTLSVHNSFMLAESEGTIVGKEQGQYCHLYFLCILVVLVTFFFILLYSIYLLFYMKVLNDLQYKMHH